MVVVSQVHLIKKIRKYFENFFQPAFLEKIFSYFFLNIVPLNSIIFFFVQISSPIEEKIRFFDFQFNSHIKCFSDIML